jgi:division protein CdvB (Snf7/Vps24/ESCRT-III family)
LFLIRRKPDTTRWVYVKLIFRKKKRDPFKDAVYALYSAKQARSRIELLMDKISSRRRRLLEMAAELELRGQKYLAKRYAQEIAKLDGIYSRLGSLNLILEKISVSLEYSITLRNFKSIAHEVLALTGQIRKLPESTIPDLSMSLANLEYSLRSIEDTGGDIVDMGNYEPATSSDVEKILAEAREILKRRLMGDADPEANSLTGTA